MPLALSMLRWVDVVRPTVPLRNNQALCVNQLHPSCYQIKGRSPDSWIEECFAAMGNELILPWQSAGKL